MPTACRGLQVRDLFAPFWNPGMYWYSGKLCPLHAEDYRFETCLHLFGTLVCIGLFWYVLVCACMYVYIHFCTGMYWYVLVILEVLVWTSMFWYIQVQLSTYWYNLVHTCMYCTWWHRNAFLKRIWRHHSRRPYEKVLSPWIKLYKAVAGGMKASYGLVQFHSGWQDFVILLATVSYCDVARYASAGHSYVIKYSTYWYVPACTGTH